MKDNVIESRNVLLGIQIDKFKVAPKFKFGRWKVYLLPPLKIIDKYERNKNYQIEGFSHEKIVLRIWLDSSNMIAQTRYYFLSSTDRETASYIVRVVIQKLQNEYPCSPKNDIKVILYPR